MRGLVQRVTRAHVTVDSTVVGEIGSGILLFVGVAVGDGPSEASRLAEKVWNLRIFDDDQGVMNRSVAEAGGQVLVVSQFTLYGDTRKGRRPGYQRAARPELAEPLVDQVGNELRSRGASVANGRFRAEMQVELVNDGPVSLWIEIDAEQ